MEQRLAVIGTFFRRPTLIPRIAQALREQTRQADELWLMYERQDDGEALHEQEWGSASPNMVYAPVPPAFVPPSLQINFALRRTTADYITYLTDDSLPYPEKYERMTAALNANPEWGAVYCSQAYGRVNSTEAWLANALGACPSVRYAERPLTAPDCVVDHSQVMHRRSDDRWPTDMGALTHSDGLFFAALVERFGAMQPIPEVLDWTCQLPDGISAR